MIVAKRVLQLAAIVCIAILNNGARAEVGVDRPVWGINFPLGHENRFGECAWPLVNLFIKENLDLQFVVEASDKTTRENCGGGSSEAYLYKFFSETNQKLTSDELLRFNREYRDSVPTQSGRPLHDFAPPPKLDLSWTGTGYSYITSDGGRVIIEYFYSRGTVCDFLFQSRLIRKEPDGTTSKILYPIALIEPKNTKYELIKNCDQDDDEEEFAPPIVVPKLVEGFRITLTKLTDGTFLAWGNKVPTAVRFDEKLNSPYLAASSVFWLEEKELVSIRADKSVRGLSDAAGFQRRLVKAIKTEKTLKKGNAP